MYENHGGAVYGLNSTKAEQKLEEFKNALDALREAQRKVAISAPHGRDFQHNGANAGPYLSARNAHIARLERLDSVITEIEAEAYNAVMQTEDMRRRG